MVKTLKWIGIGLGSLLGLVVLAVVALSLAGNAQLNKTLDIQAEEITIPNDEAALARGEHLSEVTLCIVCHGQDLSGDVILEDPAIGTVYAGNITGLGATHSDADLVKAIRHGVDQNGRWLIIMPSNIYIHLSAEDLGALVGYLKTVPRAGSEKPETKLTFLGRAMLAGGIFGEVFPAEIIDHNQPFPPMPQIGVNLEYGAYLSKLCTSCHGEDLAGLQFDPEAPTAPNITPGGELGEWSEADFIRTMRTGESPHGHRLDPEFMPWEAYASFQDEELKALWLYLQQVPAVSKEE